MTTNTYLIGTRPHHEQANTMPVLELRILEYLRGLELSPDPDRPINPFVTEEGVVSERFVTATLPLEEVQACISTLIEKGFVRRDRCIEGTKHCLRLTVAGHVAIDHGTHAKAGGPRPACINNFS